MEIMEVSMPEFRVFSADDLLPDSVPADTYSEENWEEAVEHAAAIKGYVLLRTSKRDCVAWVSPRLDVYRLMAAMVRSFDPALKDHLRERVEDIKELVRAHRMSETV
jgi:hypothetical protein